MKHIFNLLYFLVIFLISPILIYRVIRQNRYKQGWKNRFGKIERKTDKKCIWIHAVSVGEINAARTVITELENQFAEYETTGSADHLYTASGDSGSFTFVMPDSGTYYIVLEHGFLSGILSQDVMLETTINGTAITGIVIGVILIVAGIAIAFLGTRMKARESAATPPPPQTGVTFFQGQQQNPPGQV